MQKILTLTIPTWNRAQLLEELLTDVIHQIIDDNLQDKIELLISNNGSEDNTEKIVLNLSSKYNFISYHNNVVNKGARYNVLKCMELAMGQFLILFGDDDRINKSSLKKIIHFLETNPATGSLYDSHFFKKNPFGNANISLNTLLSNFYYYIGNAGLFIIKSQYIKDVLRNHPYDYFSSTWPQTQIFILASNKNISDEIHIVDLNVLAKGKHDEVMIYTSYYLWRTTYHDLVDAIDIIKNEIAEETYNAARFYFKKNITQNFFNILQCGIFLDEDETRKKTAKHIFQNLSKFSLKEKLYLTIASISLWLPTTITRTLSDTFIYLVKGNSGLKKKNDFVSKELQKRKRKLEAATKAIREFDFENV